MDIIRPLALGALLVMVATDSFAANTLKFAFTSQIGSISQPWVGSATTPAPPFAIHVGDVIQGTIEFDPAIAAQSNGEALQPHAITVHVTGTPLMTQSFSATAMDDRRDAGGICDCAYAGPVAPDPLIFIGDHFASPALPAIDDRIEITRYVVGFAFGPDYVVPGAPEWMWQPAISLIGSTNILTGDDQLPTDPATWNAFATKQFRIGIVGPRYGNVPDGWRVVGTETFVAIGSISSFVLVPEPSCLLLAVGLIAGWRRTFRKPIQRGGTP